ncbi:MAG: zinc metallopeptidase [Planctomycetales bacterium]|nr:zinc metallopeptidase [Planctomycetales bacterium]
MFFDPVYFLYLAPGLLLALWAQAKVKSTYAQASRIPSRLTGAGAARHILDAAGLQDVPIEPIAGQLTDHYDPRAKVLRLSQGVYGANSLAAVGIAAHEAGHALQDAKHYAPLVIRNLAVPAANFGGSFSFILILAGAGLAMQQLVWAGIIAFGCVAVFQIINLPVEFDASNRAKALLVSHGIVSEQEMGPINRVLNAAGWTYVAGTLQTVMILLYYVMRFSGGRD